MVDFQAATFFWNSIPAIAWPESLEGLWREAVRFDSPWLHPALVLIAGLSGLALGLALRRPQARRRRDRLANPAPAFPADLELESGTTAAKDWEAEAEAFLTLAKQRQGEIESLQGRLVSLNQQAQEKQTRFDDLARSLRIAMEGRGGPATVAIVRARWMRFAERLRIERQHVGSEAAGLQRLEVQMTREAELLQEFLKGAGALREAHRRHLDPEDPEDPALRALAPVEDKARTLHQHISGALESASRAREHLKEQQIHLRDLGSISAEIEEIFDTLEKDAAHDPVVVDNTLASLGRQVGGAHELLKKLETGLDSETRQVLDRVDWVVNDCSVALLKLLADFKQQPVSDLGLALGLTKCLRPTATLVGMLQGTQATLKGLAPSVLPQSRGTGELSEAAAEVAGCLEDARAELVRQEQEDERARHQVESQEAHWSARLADLEASLAGARSLVQTREAEQQRLEDAVREAHARLEEKEASAQRLAAALEDARGQIASLSQAADHETGELERLRTDLGLAEASLDALRSDHAASLEALAERPSRDDYEQLQAALALQLQHPQPGEAKPAAAQRSVVSVVTVPTQPGVLGRRLLGLNSSAPLRRNAVADVEPSLSDAQSALRRLMERPAPAFVTNGIEPPLSGEPEDATRDGLDADAGGLSGILPGERIRAGRPEVVLFRGRDPRLWNSFHQSEADLDLALPLELAPPDTRYLRLRRLDTGESVVAPCDYAGLSGLESGDGSWGWTGGSELYAGARHLGLYSAASTREAETRFGYGGWGFGHASGREGEQVFAWQGEIIAPVDFEISAGTLPLKEEPGAESSGLGTLPAEPTSGAEPREWRLFCGNDPSLWNRTVYRAARARALAVADLPVDAAPRWLRLARLDTGEAVVLRLAEGDSLTSDGTGRSRGFIGSGEVFYGASHLGIFDELAPQEVETRFAFGGWGFGHRQGVAEGQASGWAGREIPGDTVFEITVHEAEPPLGPRDALLQTQS